MSRKFDVYEGNAVSCQKVLSLMWQHKTDERLLQDLCRSLSLFADEKTTFDAIEFFLVGLNRHIAARFLTYTKHIHT